MIAFLVRAAFMTLLLWLVYHGSRGALVTVLALQTIAIEINAELIKEERKRR